MNPKSQTDDINQRYKLYYTMGGNIPVKTKQKVLKNWLLGVARKKIAEKVGIGEGTGNVHCTRCQGKLFQMSIYCTNLQPK